MPMPPTGDVLKDQCRCDFSSQGVGLCTHHSVEGGDREVHRLVPGVLQERYGQGDGGVRAHVGGVECGICLPMTSDEWPHESTRTRAFFWRLRRIVVWMQLRLVVCCFASRCLAQSSA